MKWSERQIARSLSKWVFRDRHLIIVPNCLWTGHECDLLVVTPNLRVIDVEIKVSRADLKADARKDKWFHSWDWKLDGPYNTAPRRPRQWPQRVWKHYYCMPTEIWTPELFAHMNPPSGLLLISGDETPQIQCERRAKPDRGADRITPEDAVNIARLASLRMWDAYDVVDRAAANNWGGQA